MPVAVTEKVAVCPAVTVWFAGCAVMDGSTTPGELLLTLEVIPEHPEFTMANSAADKTRAQRFIVRLSQEIFLSAAGERRTGTISRGVCVLPARSELDRDAGGYT